MGFYKLREWVETVTGKGDRWGRDRVGRSEPAFLSVSTIALPPSTCTARREAGQLCRQLLLCCEAGHLLAVCFLRPVPDGESAGCVCLQCLVQQAVCLLAFAMPCPLPSTFLPPFSSFCCTPLFIPCAPGSSRKLLNCPVGSSNTGLQWRPVRRFICDLPFFSCRVHDPGQWVRVELLRCTVL